LDPAEVNTISEVKYQRTVSKVNPKGIFFPIPVSISSIAFPPTQWYGCDMKEKIWFNKANSFEEAREFDTGYYLNLSSAERLETIQILRENTGN